MEVFASEHTIAFNLCFLSTLPGRKKKTKPCSANSEIKYRNKGGSLSKKQKNKILSFFPIICVCMIVCMCVIVGLCVVVCADLYIVLGSQKRVSGPPEMKSWVVVSYCIWVLGTELRLLMSGTMLLPAAETSLPSLRLKVSFVSDSRQDALQSSLPPELCWFPPLGVFTRAASLSMAIEIHPLDKERWLCQ